MKIKYINGNRLYYAVIAGGQAVIADQKYLNKINVFPVPDSDTGTNLASTMHSIAERAQAESSVKSTLDSIADAALDGARGNSGLIFAQFVYGFSRELKAEMKASTHSFGEAVKKAVRYTYQAIVTPVDGTMLSVIRDWADAVYEKRNKMTDFVELFSHSLKVARHSLRETPKKLSVLAKAGVVDAGARGFVDFLEGVVAFIKSGHLRHIPKLQPTWEDEGFHVHAKRNGLVDRFCTEALIVGRGMDIDRMREEIRPLGNSAIVAGSPDKARIHIHTNHPHDLFDRIQNYGDIVQVKADDMRRQYESSHEPRSSIALVTDSTCDLPPEVIDKHQIHVIPVNLSFGRTVFLDKVTITPDQFYTLLRTRREHPTTSIPPLKHAQNLLAFLASHYRSIIAVHLSSGLSGMYQLSRQAAESVGKKKIDVIDSRHLSVTQALIVLRIAESIESGMSHAQIVSRVGEWIEKTTLWVDILTLKYMVRGGRVSPLKGLVAKVLNLKPIITLDSEGKAAAGGKSFSRRSNMNKIIAFIREAAARDKIWNYGIVHAQNPKRARLYAERLGEVLGKKPAFVVEISPAIGVHNGVGAVGLGIMIE